MPSRSPLNEIAITFADRVSDPSGHSIQWRDPRDGVHGLVSGLLGGMLYLS